jgi:hypothetical protein
MDIEKNLEEVTLPFLVLPAFLGIGGNIVKPFCVSLIFI